MHVAESFAEALIRVVSEKLGSDDQFMRFALAGRQGIDGNKLNTWLDTLSTIQPLLNDAFEKQYINNGVKMWLEDLVELAYEMDDILDKLSTQALSQRILMEAARRTDDHQHQQQQAAATTTRNISSKIINIKKFIPTCCFCTTNFNYYLRTTDHNNNNNNNNNNMFDNRKMRSEMEDLTIKLQGIFNGINGLNLVENVGGSRRSTTMTNTTTSTTTTSSLLQVHHDESPLVFGRDDDKQFLLEQLLTTDHIEEGEGFHGDQVFRVISIVGMGRVGKTTLAQLLYHDEKVMCYFELRAWVSVSYESDVFSITKTILKSVTGGENCEMNNFNITKTIFESVSGGENCEMKNFNMLHADLTEKLSNKRFLLVLDDFWEEDIEKWNLLCAPLRAGALGSKILITTRYETVASTTSSLPAFHLDVLSNEDCISLFTETAFGPSKFGAYPNLEEIGEAIAVKCQRLPLAAKTLGKLLRTELSSDFWEEIMNSEIWRQHRYDSNPGLILCYEYLPSHLKVLFAYCSIFPYNYEFDRDELVLLWMAEGFLQQSGGDKPMEELGCKYFNELLSRSFFQRSSWSESQFVMPDLLNDLAQQIARKMSFRFGTERSLERFQGFKRARHSSFIRRKYEVLEDFKDFHGLKALRTFLPLPISISDWQEFYLSNEVLKDLLPRLQCLRVLSFSGYSISEIPESIGDLKQLRYLNLSDTLIMWLPESVTDLYNLQTLLLRRCRRLTKLPTGIGKLISLRHLDCTDTNQLREMPPGIGKLKNLRTLSKIVLGEDNGPRELRNFSDIRGKFTILGLHTVKNIEDAREANLSSKNGVDEVTMEWCYSFYDYLNRRREKDVLDILKPPTNLKKLKIILYGGTEFPTWVGHASFSSLVDLELRNCKQCTSLPSLGQLPSLKKLHIHGIDRLESVGVEFYGDGCPTVAFPSLETLSFEEMPDWKEWSMLNGCVAFPCLRELIISDCPDLTNVSLSRLPSLQVLKLNGCPEVVLKCMVSFSSLTTLTIQGISGLTRLQKETVPFLGKLEILEIKQCREMKSLWKEECPCKQLAYLGGQSGALLQSLKSLSLDDCPNLKKLPNGLRSLTSLKGLRIDNCPKIVSFPDTGLPPMLSSLKIGNCKALEVPTSNNDETVMRNNYSVHTSGNDAGENNDGHSENFSHLERLWIDDCSSLTSFPIRNLPSTLKELRVLSCMKLEVDVEQPLRNCMLSLERLTISGWKKFKTFPACFDNFTHLTELIIQRCPGLESFPETGFPSNLRTLSIYYCANLKLLPNNMQTLTLLIYLDIYGCPNLNSFPQGGLPPKLRELCLGDLGVPVSDWGLQSFSSLEFFGIIGECPKLVFFPGECRLPNSLRQLKINGAVNLESLSIDLPPLEELSIWDCPKLRSLSKTMLQSLSVLDIWRCPLLEKRCLKERGEYWPSIAQIPRVMMDVDNIREL